MMKHQNLLALLLTMFSVITVSCSNDDEDEDLMGKWYRVSDFDGLARETIAGSDYVVRIPMSHGVDSLNVAAAAAVAFWQLRTPASGK